MPTQGLALVEQLLEEGIPCNTVRGWKSIARLFLLICLSIELVFFAIGVQRPVWETIITAVARMECSLDHHVRKFAEALPRLGYGTNIRSVGKMATMKKRRRLASLDAVKPRKRSRWGSEGHLSTVLPDWWGFKLRRELRAAFTAAKPFPHVMLRPFGDTEALRAVRAELMTVEVELKETDLFKFHTTNDLGSLVLPSNGEPPLMELPAVRALVEQLYSKEFRSLIVEVTQCGNLSDRVDMAMQVYSQGCHLLCHDDVIGTRKISFIVYLTDEAEDWRPEEGGVLELYPSSDHGIPETAPTAEVLPLFNSLALFAVQPGVSYHSVREIIGHRARVGIQGWYHAPTMEETLGFQYRSFTSISQIALKAVSADSGKEIHLSEFASECSGQLLSEKDVEFLSHWVTSEYLSAESLATIGNSFAENGYAVLTKFLRRDWAAVLQTLLYESDRVDGLGADICENDSLPAYSAGLGQGWTAVGPPHLQRFLKFDASNGHEHWEPNIESRLPPRKQLGLVMSRIAEQLFKRPEFLRLLVKLTGISPPRSCTSLEVRRFRPGMDYTVATHIGSASTAELDVAFVLVNDTSTAHAVAWASEDVGGFESYVDVDSAGESTTKEDEDSVEVDAEDAPLVNLPASSNTLTLVLRDTGVKRFVKYLASNAPSSRVDVSASYSVASGDLHSGKKL